MSSFLNNLIAGLVASLLTVAMLEGLRRFRLRRRYRTLAGRYLHYSVEGARLGDGVTDIVYLGGNLLGTKSCGGDGLWEGRILMNTDIPEHGAGTYQYSGQADCGTHEIQRSLSDGLIYVRGMNTSHGKDHVFAYVWRPERLESPTAPTKPSAPTAEATQRGAT